MDDNVYVYHVTPWGLDTHAELAKPGQRRVAVLGSMAELGAQSEAYHRHDSLRRLAVPELWDRGRTAIGWS